MHVCQTCLGPGWLCGDPHPLHYFPGQQVWRAVCLPFNEEVAVKLLDLENVNCSLVIPSAQHIAGRYTAKDVSLAYMRY